MSFWATVFVVLMVIWLVFGLWSGYRGGQQQDQLPALGGTIIPWACVAILGWLVLGGK